MDPTQICKQNYNSPISKTSGVGYSKLKTYSSNPLCTPFQEKSFLKEQEPSMQIHQNMCRSNTECKNTENYTYLNQRGVNYSPYFKEVGGKYSSTKQDGRLVDAPRSYTMRLDSKPVQVIYNLINDNVSGNAELKDYGKNYTSYSTVTGGQIQYYIDKELSEPFNSPVYGVKTQAVGYTYKDPMDSIKPQFDKAYPRDSFSCLSWIDDSSSFRDDITARQQRTHNERRYELVYNRLK